MPLKLVGITLAIGNHFLGPCKLNVADWTEIVFLATLQVNIAASRAEDDWLEIVRSADARPLTAHGGNGGCASFDARGHRDRSNTSRWKSRSRCRPARRGNGGSPTAGMTQDRSAFPVEASPLKPCFRFGNDIWINGLQCYAGIAMRAAHERSALIAQGGRRLRVRLGFKCVQPTHRFLKAGSDGDQCPARSFAGAQRARVSRGTTIGPQWSISNTRSTAIASRLSASHHEG